MTDDKLCPCDSDQSFVSCCEPFLKGSQRVTTAEQLMRSRYSAYCSANVNYLIASHHPSRRQTNDASMYKRAIRTTRWIKLTVVECKQGNADDYTGDVIFVASFVQDDTLGQLYERSHFVKEEGQWFYLDGDVFDTVPKQYKWQRNDLCWCGSGKKLKKCHSL
jgi:SEC-C motif-containing protein